MKQLYIYYKDESNLIGTLYIDESRGKEVYSFEYSDYALKNNLSNLIIDEEIQFTPGRQFKSDSSSLYRFLSDIAPDRWGKNLIKRKLGKSSLFFSDYLANVSDISRMGALRLKEDKNGPFILDGDNIPPFRFIKELEHAAYFYDQLSDNDDWKILLSPGSSLGGARPKSSIYDKNGELYLAKFSHKNDEYDVSKIEYFTYELANLVGINMSPSKYIEISANHGVFLTKRFDRDNQKRIHYVSFMTILNAKEGDSSSYSYLDVAEAISRLSVSKTDDLHELFKRIAFYIIVHNYDDHLRNIGMIYSENGFRLAPCFDVNLTFYNSHLTLSIDGSDDYSLDNLIKNAKYFELNNYEAEILVSYMVQEIKKSYEKIAESIKIESSLIRKLKQILIG